MNKEQYFKEYAEFENGEPGVVFGQPNINSAFEAYWQASHEKDSAGLLDSPLGNGMRPLIKKLMQSAFIAGTVLGHQATLEGLS